MFEQDAFVERRRLCWVQRHSVFGPFSLATNINDSFTSSGSMNDKKTASTYWTQSLRIVLLILGIWATISLGCGILFRDLLDSVMPKIGNAPFGFWMAQQGSIIGFLGLLVLYMLLMNWLDRRHGFDGKRS